MRSSLVGMTLAAALIGCGVSKDVYLQRESELAACRGGLASSEAALVACRQEADARQRDLEAVRAEQGRARQELDAFLAEKAGTDKRKLAELEECRRKGADDLAACKEAAARAQAEEANTRAKLAASKSETEAAQREVEALKAREAELRARLEKELREQTVEIERLRAKLSVRVLDHILFDSGSAEILKDGKAVLDKVAETIAGTAERVRVEGHSDDVPVSKRLKGKYFSNWELSAARAANVVRYFQYGKGVAPTRMEAVGLAQYYPDAPNESFEGRAQNRRVVIILTPPKEAPSDASAPPAASR